ncbi:MAG: secondary thiamine-phosphate synthase enzyme YjbQ [Ignisphaera sp.]|nr:secondary thiamine-phosphate synthase enzyme YjbQ [Ignisphaera sp.]MCX8167968.1 secondary thiamine-phosphate synthase enzyme YjbQ [Ignisphaera sp.]MDW8085565.1 secondary thiamine-phosphate synthase enzyme YjbQ [Ignisphaera sp.]
MFKVYHEVLTLSTVRQFQLIDITKDVEKIVERSGIKDGICVVFAPHATGAIIANENEAGLLDDITTFVREFTESDREWKHNRIDDNAHAHIGSAVISSERVFPVIGWRLVRGTWQNIFFVEMDGPRPYRNVVVMVLGSIS